MSKQTTERLPLPAVGKNAYTMRNALTRGGPVAWLSCLVMGFGNIMGHQIIKGLIFLIIEVAYLWFMFTPRGGIHWLSLLGPMGDYQRIEIVKEHPIIGEYTEYINTGDASQITLLYGVTTIALTIIFVFAWWLSIRSGYQACSKRKAGEHVNTFFEDLKSLLDENIHNLLMTPPIIGILVFTVLPLIYMMCMAFTNYTEPDNLVVFDWVGLDTFRQVLDFNGSIGKQFWSVLGWTLIWAFFATFLNFFLGTFVAIIINRNTTRLKGLWRGCLSVTIAVPQFVSLLVMRSMLTDNGIINVLLKQAGHDMIPFLSNTNWARITVIVVNLWVGIPYTIMQVTGILKNIPAEQYEAARIDGANAVQQFMNITLPYMIFVMTPYIITSFTSNINNFGVIYLLTGGNPTKVGNTAGGTDLLVTWLYKLSVDKFQYNIAAVIGILTFIVLSIVSLVTYRNSGSYKDEEGFK